MQGERGGRREGRKEREGGRVDRRDWNATKGWGGTGPRAKGP